MTCLQEWVYLLNFMRSCRHRCRFWRHSPHMVKSMPMHYLLPPGSTHTKKYEPSELDEFCDPARGSDGAMTEESNLTVWRCIQSHTYQSHAYQSQTYQSHTYQSHTYQRRATKTKHSQIAFAVRCIPQLYSTCIPHVFHIACEVRGGGKDPQKKNMCVPMLSKDMSFSKNTNLKKISVSDLGLCYNITRTRLSYH